MGYDHLNVTIAIINHNYDLFLAYAVDSALAQSESAEVIVVDDGSCDNSRSIIASYGDRIIPVLKSAGGHVSAINAAYEVATGDVCIFLDADDILYPNCVEVLLRAWQSGDIKLQYRLDTIDGSGHDQRMPFPHFSSDLTPEEVRTQALRHGVYPWTVSSGNAYSRKFLDALLPIDTNEIYRSPDGYLNKMAPLFGDVRSIYDVLGAYRVHGANTWAQSGKMLKIEPIIHWLKFDQVLQKFFEREAEKRGIVVTPYEKINTLQQMEHRFIAYRFAPGQFEQPGASPMHLFFTGIGAARIAPNLSKIGSVVWIVWFFIMAFMPRIIVRSIFDVARAQTGRSVISRLLVRWARGYSRTKRD